MTARLDFRPRPPRNDRPRAPLVRSSDVAPCDGCGDRIGPWWGRNGQRWCERCAPADLKRKRTER